MGTKTEWDFENTGNCVAYTHGYLDATYKRRMNPHIKDNPYYKLGYRDANENKPARAELRK